MKVNNKYFNYYCFNYKSMKPNVFTIQNKHCSKYKLTKIWMQQENVCPCLHNQVRIIVNLTFLTIWCKGSVQTTEKSSLYVLYTD